MTDADLPIRHGARAVLLDALDRILLFEGQIWERNPRLAWYLPGGGVEAGETHEEALVRELAEEIGLVDAPVGPWVWIRRSFRYTQTGDVRSHSRFFVVRCDCLDVDTSGAGIESGNQWRWWTLDELAAAPPRSFVPTALPSLVRDLIEGRVPSSPIDASD